MSLCVGGTEDATCCSQGYVLFITPPKLSKIPTLFCGALRAPQLGLVWKGFLKSLYIEIDEDEDNVYGGVDGHNVGAEEEEEEEEEEGSDADNCPSSEDASGWDGLEEDLDDDSDLGEIDFDTLF